MKETKTFDQLSDEDLTEIVKTMRSKALAARVVIWRHLGLQKRLAVACMQELSNRREAGEDFDYETYIKEELATMPPIRTDQVQRNIIMSLLKGNIKDV